MMKKFLRTFVSVMLVLTLLLSVTACKKGPKDPTDPTDPSEGQQAELVVSSALGLDLYERKELVARDKNGAVVAATWTVADATIATVSANGLVSAMKDGKTTVTATYGEHTADCEVTVRDSGERPSMSIVSDKKVTVVGGKTSVTPVCTYKNEDMPFQMTVSGGNDEVVTYVVEDGTITFTGVAIGSTSVEISGTCGNYTLTPITLPIEIVDSTSIVYADGNLTLSTLNDPENGWIASHPVEISVYDGEQLLGGVELITWETSDATVASYDAESGCVVAAGKEGVATLRANYGEVYIEFTVTVVRANITVAAGLSITDTYKKVDLAFIQEMVGSLDGVTIYDETNGQNLTYTLNGTVATLTNYTGSVGYMIWAFNTPGISVKTEVMHATHRIASKKDFALLGKDWREATLGNVTSTIVYSNGTDNWMVALAADLDFTGDANVTNDVLFGSNAAADGYVAVFNGTFDGRGYAIKNAAFNNGFICNLGDTGVIRNTALINCKPLNGGGVLGNYGRGTVDNCYVEGTLSGATQAGAYYYSSGKMLRVKNTVFKLIGTGQQGVVTTQAAAASEPNIENVYCISTSVNKIWGNDATGGAGVIYANASAWANDIGSLPVGYSSFWKMTDGGLMFGANRVLSW